MKFQVLPVVVVFPGLSITELNIAISPAARIFQAHRVLLIPADS